MRDSSSWRGQCRQEECYYSPNQSWTWTQNLVGCQVRMSRRAVDILVLFLISWFVAGTLTRFRTPPSISTKSVPRRAFVLELFRYSQPRNRSITALAPVHRRRQRGLLGTRVSTPQEIFDEEQEEQLLDGQVVRDDLTRESDSFKKRRGCDESMGNPLEASSSTRPALRGNEWPVVGGVRGSDRHLQPFFAEVPIGYYGLTRSYRLIPDTASGLTWVNCQGSKLVGDSGQFFPAANSFLNCEEDRSLCEGFQDREGSEYPCDEINNFRCFYDLEYLDGSESSGSVIKADVRFGLSDAPGVLISLAFGCAVAGKGSDLERQERDSVGEDDDTMDEPTSDSSSDGVLGLTSHSSGWLRQLYLNGLVSEYVVTVCLEPARPVYGPRSPFFERAGFVSFGDLYAAQSASTIWTTSIATYAMESYAMHVAELVEINYRGEVIDLRSRARAQERGVRMEFDTGSSLTYLDPTVFMKVDSVLKEDARRMNFKEIQDDRTRNTFKRSCWRDKREKRKTLVREFGDLIMKFSSLADDGSTSDFVIKPEYYLTSGGVRITRTCFNMRMENSDDVECILGGANHIVLSYLGVISGEAMRGHLLIFSEQSGRIGWSPVTSCDNLRPTSSLE